MKTRYKITSGIVIFFVSVIIMNMFGTTCILTDGDTSKNWLGSVNGCGPLLTYTIHQYFGIFW
ncbi:MAG: hypothetical protein K5798_09985 [Nitrosopumilus sp.]|uniref:hypothetical protein n=1 Tax=Nitrosopumilus sp. TaxID=2024843 RepID=UPI00242BCADB|nr:hypothetical protein [Nitrosopumilus sp.]MCV0367573.1 hypothetical protein [Nitrosopumilus sp.]